MTDRRFPPPWTVEKIPGGLKVCDANAQSLAYVFSRETPADAITAHVLTEDEARRISSNIAKLPALLRGNPVDPSDLNTAQNKGTAPVAFFPHQDGNRPFK